MIADREYVFLLSQKLHGHAAEEFHKEYTLWVTAGL